MEQMKIIGWVRTDFPEKFGAPRQSGLVRELTGRIEFAPEYRNKEAFRGLDEYSHLWILWQFSESIRDGSSTARSRTIGGRLCVRRGWAATGAWVCLQHARRFAQTPSDFPVSGWSRSVWMEKRHRT